MSQVQELSEKTQRERPSPVGQVFGMKLADAKDLLADPAAAEAQAREMLAADARDPGASLLLGAALRRGGDVAAARAVLEPLAAANPDWAEIRLELGLALGTLGENKAAIRVLMEAVNLDKNYSAAWSALGEQFFLIGDGESSDAAYSHHFNSSIAEPQLQRAVTALRNGRADIAEDILIDYLEYHPDDVNALKALAEAAMSVDRMEDASELFARCVELAPDFAAARYRYVLTLYLRNRLVEGLEHIEWLLERDPRNPQFRSMKAGILSQMGNDAEALPLFEELLGEYSGHPGSWVTYGHALKSAGQQPEAVAAYRKSIELQPALGGSYWSLANLKIFRFRDDEIQAMLEQLERTDLRIESRVQLYFSLGKAYEDLKDFEKSFEHYQKGNALWRCTITYNAEATSDSIPVFKEIFSKQFFEDRAGYGYHAPDPIFVVGLPRSGSTLIEQILSSHSAIEGTMELSNITVLAKRLNDANIPNEGPFYPDLLHVISPEEARRGGVEYIEDTRSYRRLGRPFFIDKMPNNFVHIGLIQLILPRAKIIDARRHPMGACFSNFKQHFARGQLFTYSLNDIGSYYRNYVELMAHYDQVLPGRVHRLHYEQVVENPEHEVRRLLDYLELPFEESCLKFYETNRSVRTASSQQVRVPLYKSGIDQWRNYEPWLGPLKTALGPVLDAYPGIPDFDAGA